MARFKNPINIIHKTTGGSLLVEETKADIQTYTEYVHLANDIVSVQNIENGVKAPLITFNIGGGGATITNYLKSFEIGAIATDGTWRFNYVSVVDGVEKVKEYSRYFYTTTKIDNLLNDKADKTSLTDYMTITAFTTAIADYYTKTQIDNLLNSYTLASDFENFQDGAVTNIDLDSTHNYQLKITKGDGNSSYLNIAGNTRYRHFYTIKPTQSWASPGVSFFVDLPSSTPLTSDGLFNYLGLTPFWSTTTPAYNIFPVTGVTGVTDGLPRCAIGMFVYIEDSGGMISKSLKVLYNYNSTATFDVTTLSCVGIQDRFVGSWISLSQTRYAKTNDDETPNYNEMNFKSNLDFDAKKDELLEQQNYFKNRQELLKDTKSKEASIDKLEIIDRELNVVDDILINQIPKALKLIDTIKNTKDDIPTKEVDFFYNEVE